MTNGRAAFVRATTWITVVFDTLSELILGPEEDVESIYKG